MTQPPTFQQYADVQPYDLIDRFAGDIRPDIVAQRVPIMSPKASDLAFASYGLAAGSDWVLEGKYGGKRSAPMLFNWRVLLGLTGHGRPYLAELVERRHLGLAALVWKMAEDALRRYNVLTFEMFERCMQAAYVDYLDPKRESREYQSYPLRHEELPVFTHYYNEQLDDPEFIAAVKSMFDCVYGVLSDSREFVARTVGKIAVPEHVSAIYMDLIRGHRDPIPTEIPKLNYPIPPFGPVRPGMYLYELLYAYSFRYRPGGVRVLSEPVLNGETLPSALVINFDKFIRYREAHMHFYNKVRGRKQMSLYDLGLAAAEVMRAHYYGILQNQNIEKYYAFVNQEGAPLPAEEFASMFIMPTALVRKLKDSACQYGVNHLSLDTSIPRRKKEETKRYRRAISAKAILSVKSPETPYLPPSEFRFVHRYNTTLISPPWPLSMMEVLDYFKEQRVMRVAQHLDRVYVTLDTLRRLESAQNYMTTELTTWLRGYAEMSKYVLAAEIRIRNRHGINTLVREDYGAAHLNFLPEEDDAILRLYRPRMPSEQRDELKRICFGRSNRSISSRAAALREELMAKGVLNLSDLPHGARNEKLLTRIREEKMKAARKARQDAEALSGGGDSGAVHGDGTDELP